MTKGDRVIGYVRVSTREQGEAGNGLEAQREAILREARYRGLQLLRIEEDVASGKSTKKRPGLERALASCRSGEASGIVIGKLDRATRSLRDFLDLVEAAEKHGYNLVAADQQFDLSTSNGRAMAGMLAVFAQLEREQISERTKAAMRIVKKRTAAQRKTLGKKPIGRPPRVVDTQLQKRIRRERKAGLTYRQIAAVLEADHVKAPGGKKRWYPSSVQRLS